MATSERTYLIAHAGKVTAPSPRPASFRTLGRQTAIYSFGVMLGRAVSFLMLPVSTRYLTPSD